MFSQGVLPTSIYLARHVQACDLTDAEQTLTLLTLYEFHSSGTAMVHRLSLQFKPPPEKRA